MYALHVTSKTWRLLLVGLICLVLAGAIFVYLDWTDDRAEAKVPEPHARQIAGHRGTVVGEDENTLAAMRYAYEGGADILETDVRLTSDGKMVVMHDATLDRTTNCTGPVSRRTLAYIKACKTPRGEHPPSYRQLLQWIGVTDQDLEVWPELKGTWTQAQVTRFVNESAMYNLGNIVAQSQSASNLHKVQVANDALSDETAGNHLDVALVDTNAPPADLDPICVLYNGFVVNLDYASDALSRNLQEDCDPPTTVGVYGVRTNVELEQAYETGALVIIADDPKGAVAWLRAR